MVFSQTPRRGRFRSAQQLRSVSFRLLASELMRRAIHLIGAPGSHWPGPCWRRLTRPQPRSVGFSPEAATQPRIDWEQKFRAIPSLDNLRESMKPAHRASASRRFPLRRAERKVARAAKFKQWGWDTRVETFQVLFPTPIDRTGGAGRSRHTS
jgi:hypothetical protein